MNPISFHFFCRFAVILVGGVFLASCASPGIQRLDEPIVSSPVIGDLLSSKRQTEGTRAILETNGETKAFQKDPDAVIAARYESLSSGSSSEERLAVIELCTDTGESRADEDSHAAVGYFLAAAELSYPSAIDAAANGTTEGDLVARAYAHSVARVATLLFEIDPTGRETVEAKGPWRSYRVRCRTKGGGNVVDPAAFDRLESADRIELVNYEMKRIRREGFGAAMILHQEGSEKRREANPFLSPIGMTVPVNAVLDFGHGRGGEVEVRYTDLLLTEEVRVGGRILPAAADLTIPLAVMVDYDVDRKAGFKAMTHPDRYLDHTGLYQLEPFRPNQIPIVLVHGLMSSPEVWVKAINELRADPGIRKNYQLLVFRYSTGFPIAYNSAFLRKRLSEFRNFYDPSGTNPRMSDKVLVGHSMGGILSNAQVRPSGDAFTGALFDRPIEELGGVTEDQKRALREMLVFDANREVTRVICVAAPHRGSNLATGFIGNLGHGLVRFPREVMLGASLLDVEGLTDEGRAIIRDRPDSVRGLKPDSPVLEAILANPIRDGVAMHSIVGRHKPEQDLEESSDTVVPYLSAHLDEAVSEKVVHATHTTICQNEDAIEELRRILYLHAGLPAPSRPE